MSHGSSKKKDDDELDTKTTAIITVLVAALIAGGALFGELGWPRLHGTTPAELADQSLSRTASQLAHDLPAATSHDKTSCEVRFKVGSAGAYEKADFTWDTAGLDAADGMRLRTEHHAEDAASEVTAALMRHFHGLSDGRHKWGAVRIRVHDDGDLDFDVDRSIDGKPNPLFGRQVEAAKEVVLNAAFGTPLRVSEREIADVLGSGYPPSDLTKLDIATPVERAGAAVRAIFPAALASGSSSFNVPLDHPIVTKVRLSWHNRAGGELYGIDLTTSSAYMASRQIFESCLEKKLGAPKVDVTDYAAGKKDYDFAIGSLGVALSESSMSMHVTPPLDAVSIAAFAKALDACRETTEGGAAGSDRK